jgi:branched-chain amino acid transport system ATP-binding protein
VTGPRSWPDCKEFKGFVAVKPGGPEGPARHIHALIGPNGAGKTTCFNLLTKFLTPTAGQILFDGPRHHAEKPAQIARRGIIRSFQISAVFPHLTCWRTCAWPAAPAGQLVPLLAFRAQPGRSSTTAPWNCCAAVDLETLPHGLTAVELPYGRKRALEIATTLAMDPKLMLLDEPTQGMGHEDVDRVTPAHQEGFGRPHGADGRAQHERGGASIADTITVLQRGATWPRGPTPRSRPTRR